MKKIFQKITLVTFLAFSFSCANEFLDIVPEGVPSLENAFSNRTNAEKFLHTCYSYLPSFENAASAPGFLAGGEYALHNTKPEHRTGLDVWYIGQGLQNSNDPYLNYWDGGRSGSNMWVAIRDCNIFLENIHKPQDLSQFERMRWESEVKFLKAYYHFWMLQCYGPIPIVDANLEVNAGVDEVRVSRKPVDEVIAYITNLLDESLENLPNVIELEGTEFGRITKSMAYAVKAKTLVLAASPLFNGNPDYANYIDKKGVKLFPENVDNAKWEKAAAACKEAIDFAEANGHQLYKFFSAIALTDYTKTKLSISEAVCDRWNPEIVWGSSRNSNGLQQLSYPKISSTLNNWNAYSMLSPTMEVAEQFYSNNGVPIEEDNGEYWTAEYKNRYRPTVIPDEYPNQYNLQVGEKTAKLHLKREPRFYANLGFNRGKWYVSGVPNDSAAVAHLRNYRGEYSGLITTEDYSITGYYPRKIISYRSEVTNTSYTSYRYAFPIIRLADLYLLYAESLNESLGSPSAEVYQAVDKIRERAGLKGVKESWAKHSKFPAKPDTKEGMRDIIQHERKCELALEGQVLWDKKRWKEPLKRYIQGWNINANGEAGYYELTTLFDRGAYTYKEYFWPIKTTSIQKNPNLLQSPGW